MALADRLKQSAARASAVEPPDEVAPAVYREVKGELHRRLVDRVDLSTIQKLPLDRLRDELRAILATMTADAKLPLNAGERERILEEILRDVTGLGPLEPLLADPSISDILVNTHRTVYVERAGRLHSTRVRFDDDEHVMQVINRIVSRVGRRIDEMSPMVDARLPDGSRVNAIIPPLAIDGPILSIRRFGVRPLTIRDLMTLGSVTPEAAAFLGACVQAKLNLLVSGGTGTGKTTMLNALSAFIPATERVITIEDSAELQLQQPHVVRLETRPANIEGEGEIVARDLVRNSLRMRPDRIIVGEVRAGEVLDMLQAMNTGHEGSMTTVHANTPRDALTRLEAMIGMAGVPLSEQSTRQTIARGINVIVHLGRGVDGRRRITQISEVTGVEGATIVMQDLHKFEQRGVDEDGRVLGDFLATGIRPKSLERIERAGLEPKKVLDAHLRAECSSS